jgi:hypothetical protein
VIEGGESQTTGAHEAATPASRDSVRQSPDCRSGWLRRLSLGATLAVFALTSATGRADTASHPNEPVFSAADLTTIARNQTLKDAVGRSPWSVYQALRIIEAQRPNDRVLTSPKDGSAPGHFDPSRDPDLGKLQRIAPEAAHDLFLLIKKASKPKK